MESGPAYFKVAAPGPVAAGFTLGGTGAAALAEAPGPEADATLAENRRALLEGLGRDSFSTLLTARQVHGKRSLTVADCHPATLAGVAASEADALLTDQAGVLLGVLTADCLPLIMVERQGRAVAVVHAGWRGLAQAIGPAAVAEFECRFGVAADELEVYVGPAIGFCCFQVGLEVIDCFRGQAALAGSEAWWRQRPSGYYVDLTAIQKAQLLQVGVPAENVHVLDICTCCHDFCFSYRRDHAISGRQLAFVGIRENTVSV
ncbi:MAG: peptidoglycan editing factor PgeF [Deltaproteobacteria bacterium]|nr:peptidoglycan editing factor PgeF [Deltaproteobacteria bacterium]